MVASAKFSLHKWNSNVSELETPSNDEDGETETFAKQQLRGPMSEEASIFGVPWRKRDDTLRVYQLPFTRAETTKRGVLGGKNREDL